MGVPNIRLTWLRLLINYCNTLSVDSCLIGLVDAHADGVLLSNSSFVCVEFQAVVRCLTIWCLSCGTSRNDIRAVDARQCPLGPNIKYKYPMVPI